MSGTMEFTLEQNQLFEKHLELMLKENETTNLTSIRSIEQGRILHIEDSLVALEEIEKAPVGRYADLGTGGGYPGIPLAIMTGRETLLVDSVKKKTVILDRIITELELNEQISTYAGRIEDLALEEPGKFSVITARALAKLSVLMELASPLLSSGGILVCYKAQVDEEEYQHALQLKKKLGFELSSDRTIELSDGETVRRIIVFTKIGKAQIKLPRKMGFAQKRPL